MDAVRLGPVPGRNRGHLPLVARCALPDHNLDALFRPRTIAVVGVPSTREGPPFPFFRGLLEMGFTDETSEAPGRLYPVNPKLTEYQGLPCYPDLRAIPGPVDYVICAIPAASVPDLLEQCIEKGVRLLHLFTSGFTETGDAARAELERRIIARARAGGVRIIGPNCVGFYRPAARIAWSPGFPREPGSVGVLSQSGGHAAQLVREGGLRGLRFSTVVSYGNASDLNETDLLHYLAHDPDTTLIGCYIEGPRGGREFFPALREAAARKPVAVLKGGLTEAGARTAASHTASLAGTAAVWDAAIRQAGAVRVGDLEELEDLLLARQFLGRLSGRRVGIVGAGGGNVVQAADEAIRAGLEVPPLPATARAQIARFTPIAGTIIQNPLDTIAENWSDAFGDTLIALGGTGAVDMLLAWLELGWAVWKYTGATEAQIAATVAQLVRARDETGLPLAAVFRAPPDPAAWTHYRLLAAHTAAARIPLFPSIRRAALALARLAAWPVVGEG